MTLSQFWPSLWGFEKRKVRLGKGVWGIVVGCVAGIAWVIGMVMRKGLDGGRDAGSWAWIDVVSKIGLFSHVSPDTMWNRNKLADRRYFRSMPLVMSSWSSR